MTAIRDHLTISWKLNTSMKGYGAACGLREADFKQGAWAELDREVGGDLQLAYVI